MRKILPNYQTLLMHDIIIYRKLKRDGGETFEKC